MIVDLATQADVASWLDLAAEVEPLFGPMVGDPAFCQALRRNVARRSAFCVRAAGGPPGATLIGGLLFSSHRPIYRIGWLAVATGWRGQGVGELLVRHVLALVQPPAEVGVVTFGEDFAAGRPARRFYERLGFVAAELTSPGPDGGSRQVYRLVLPGN